MRRFLSFLMVGILLVPATTHAFDGMRKGFVLGGGLGFVPYASWSFDVFDATIDESKAAMGGQIIIGYGWDEQNLLVFEANAAGYSSDFFLGTTDHYNYFYKRTISQGFAGPAWYHYFGPVGKSFFTMVGLGFYAFDVEGLDEGDAGGAILFGAGYEFTRHVQVGVYAGGGKTHNWGLDFTHGQISVLVSGVAF